jgi:hypothetical protein
VQGLKDLETKTRQRWENLRGEKDGTPLEPMLWNSNSFLIGAWLVDRKILLEAGEAEPAAALSQRIAKSLNALDMADQAAPFQEDWQREEKLGTDAARQAFVRELRASAEEREKRLEDETSFLSPEHFALGKWAEAARIAATAQNSKFFERRPNRRFLAYLSENEEIEPEIRQKLEEIARLWDEGDLQAEQFTALAQKLDEIIEDYDRRASAAADDFDSLGEDSGL